MEKILDFLRAHLSMVVSLARRSPLGVCEAARRFQLLVSRKTGEVAPSTQMDGFRVNRDLRNDMLPHMYGLRKEIDLSFLTGRELIQVYFDGQEEWIWKPEPGAAQIAARTVSLLGATIQNFEGQENGTLILTFSNGGRLTIPDSSQEYESYQITRPGQTIIV